MFGFLKKTRSAGTLPPLSAIQLRPRIKHVNYLQTLRDTGVPPDQILEYIPLCGELPITYAYCLSTQIMVRRDHAWTLFESN